MKANILMFIICNLFHIYSNKPDCRNKIHSLRPNKTVDTIFFHNERLGFHLCILSCTILLPLRKQNKNSSQQLIACTYFCVFSEVTDMMKFACIRQVTIAIKLHQYISFYIIKVIVLLQDILKFITKCEQQQFLPCFIVFLFGKDTTSWASLVILLPSPK